MHRHQIGPALHEQPAFSNAAPLQLGRELEAASRLIPEQIVGDEHVRAGRLEIVAHAVDRAKPDAAVVDRPDGTKRTTKRAAAPGLDQPHRPQQQARIPAPPCVDVPALRHGHVIQRERAIRGPRARESSVAAAHQQPGHFRRAATRVERVGQRRHDQLTVFRADGIDTAIEKR
jgi:hypothetical protein